MVDMSTIEAKYQALSSRLDEAALRTWAAAEARSLGRGGVSMVAKAIGMSRTTIHAGLSELKAAPAALASMRKTPTRPRVRAPGGGRKKLAAKDASLLTDVTQAKRISPMVGAFWWSLLFIGECVTSVDMLTGVLTDLSVGGEINVQTLWIKSSN